MAVSVQYDQDQKMIITGVDCACGCDHHAIDKDIYIGKGLIEKIPAYIEKKNLGRHCVLVADDNTYRVAGADVEKALTENGFSVVACVIHRKGEMLPDDLSCGEVLLSITRETEFLIAVGSGTVTDTTRINAERTGLPFVSVGTAPSMDGYASAVAPLLHRGLKIQHPAKCPEIIVCDLDVLATAPLHMIASGVGDVLGKYIAKADWELGRIINGETCCPVCVEMVTNAVNALVENADEIARKTEKGMRILIEALLLAGVTILIIDNTRAVASIEHNIAQYWEMMLVQQGKEVPMHGASVGVATLLVWPVFERFAREDLTKLDVEEIKARRMSREKREKWMLHAYGQEGGKQIMRENPGDFLTWEEQLRRIRTAQEHVEEIRQVIAAMPPLEKIRQVMETLHAEMTPEEEHIPQELLYRSMHCGKDYRTRYTLFKLLDECGLLDEYLAAYPYPFE